MAEASKNTLDDLELVKRAKENDSRAFEKLAKSCRCISEIDDMSNRHLIQLDDFLSH